MMMLEMSMIMAREGAINLHCNGHLLTCSNQSMALETLTTKWMLKGTKVVVKSGKNSSKRMGPNKGTHRHHYNTFVANSITQYSEQMQTNLHIHCTLLNYIPMNDDGRRRRCEEQMHCWCVWMEDSTMQEQGHGGGHGSNSVSQCKACCVTFVFDATRFNAIARIWQ